MTTRGLENLRRRLRAALVHPATLVSVPLIILLSNEWERRVMVAALVLFLVAGAIRSLLARKEHGAHPKLPGQSTFDTCLGNILGAGERARSACLLLRPNDADAAETARRASYPPETMERLAERIRPILRDDDLIARLQGDTIAVALSNRRALTIESVIQIALRLQRRIDMPAETGEPVLTTGVRVGIALSKEDDCAERLRLRAKRALDEAEPGAIRCETTDPTDRDALAVELARDLPGAFGAGEIIAHFQPQVCTDTGLLTGVEALVRWQHPRHGLLVPAQFLETCEAADLMGNLTEAMVRAALEALTEWDRAGLDVPRVSVNFTLRDLSDPSLINRLSWMLDAAEVEPHRLGIEVLESVLCLQDDGPVSQTLEALRDMGCFIDLDDFGTGSASITNIRRLAVQRLKIDQSFVRGVDHDPDQRNMVAAILTMAEQLEIDTLAEGIETAEEFAMLAQLGCSHVQGFGIGRPMPGMQLPRWMAERKVADIALHLPEALRHLPSCPPPPTAGHVAAIGPRDSQAKHDRTPRPKGGRGKTA